MRRGLYTSLSVFRHHLVLLNMLCAIGVAFSSTIALSHTATAYASTFQVQDVTSCQNPPQPAPDSNSLLVVLLDRSGSLVANPGGTDPTLYSASVTRALADLWPGKMAVVAFNTTTASGSEQVQLNIIGPSSVGSSKAQREDLKNKILLLPKPNLGTPTGPAMDKALEIIRNENAPLAKVVLITDGQPGYLSNNASENDPDGSKEEQHIRTTLLQQFCDATIPVDTIGLKTDANANQFLSDIATGTGGQYRSVQDPGDLANAVFTLYGQWQKNRLNFQPLQLQQDQTYHIAVGDLARSLNFFVFRSSNTVTVKDPSGQSLPIVENSSDPHYVYDTVDLAPPRPQGDYSIDVGGDPQAQVYAFIASSLNVGIDAPSGTTQQLIDQHVQIEAKLLDGQKPLQQLKDTATLTAQVTFTTPGQHPITEQVELQQQNGQNRFTGQTKATYPQAGQLQVSVIANYIGLRAEADLTTPVICGFSMLSSVPCLIKQNQTVLLITSPLLALALLALLAWLLWRMQPAPFGTLQTPPSPQRKRRRRDDDDDDDVILSLPRVEASHPLLQRILHRSLLTSREIQTHPDTRGNLDFDLASFGLRFKKNHVAELTSTASEQIIIKREDNQSEKLEQGQSTVLKSGDIIRVSDQDRAIFFK